MTNLDTLESVLLFRNGNEVVLLILTIAFLGYIAIRRTQLTLSSTRKAYLNSFIMILIGLSLNLLVSTLGGITIETSNVVYEIITWIFNGGAILFMVF